MLRPLSGFRKKLELAGFHIGDWSYLYLYGSRETDWRGWTIYVESFNKFFQISFILVYGPFLFGTLEKGIIDILSFAIDVAWYWHYYSFSRHGLLLITAGSFFLAVESLLPKGSSRSPIFSRGWFEEGSEQRLQAVTILGAGLISIGSSLQLIGTFSFINENESPIILLVSVFSLLGLLSLYAEAAGYGEEFEEVLKQWGSTNLDAKRALWNGFRDTTSSGGLAIILLFGTFDIVGSALLPIGSQNPVQLLFSGLLSTIPPSISIVMSIIFLTASLYFLSVSVEAFTNPWARPLTTVTNSIFQIQLAKSGRILLSGAIILVFWMAANFISLGILSFVIEKLYYTINVTAMLVLLVFVFLISFYIPYSLLLTPYCIAILEMTLFESFSYSWKITYGYKRTMFYVTYLAFLFGLIISLVMMIPSLLLGVIHSHLANFLAYISFHAFIVYVLAVISDVFAQIIVLTE